MTINNNRIGSLNPLKMKGKKRKKDGINSLNDYYRLLISDTHEDLMIVYIQNRTTPWL